MCSDLLQARTECTTLRCSVTRTSGSSRPKPANLHVTGAKELPRGTAVGQGITYFGVAATAAISTPEKAEENAGGAYPKVNIQVHGAPRHRGRRVHGPGAQVTHPPPNRSPCP
jgi:hypothetical protein